MAEKILSTNRAKRPQMTPEAPWSSVGSKRAPYKERPTAVVYVIGEDGGPRAKLGVTTQLKKRLAALQGEDCTLHIMHWAEFGREDARRVECAALRAMREFEGLSGGEWFTSHPAVLARAISLAACQLQILPINAAGVPGALDDELGEVEEILAEPLSLIEKNGRMDREAWAPQRRAISR